MRPLDPPAELKLKKIKNFRKKRELPVYTNANSSPIK
jgi:hypothetical protein